MRSEYPFVFENKWGYYDISHCYLDPFPAEFYDGYLAIPDVQQALGVPVNYTEGSSSIGLAFNKTGDYARDDKNGYVNDIGTLLDSNVQVALVYGDRDYACNWVGGEAFSHAVEYSHSSDFNKAGYADIVLGDGADQPWGVVRQHGNYSFSRIYQSGHMVPAYQPELALEIFRRAQSNYDFATGKVNITANPDYSTSGDANSTHTEKPTSTPSPTCYYWFMQSSCAQVQIDAVEGKAEFKNDYIITSPTPPPSTCPQPTSGGSKDGFSLGGQKVLGGEEL